MGVRGACVSEQSRLSDLIMMPYLEGSDQMQVAYYEFGNVRSPLNIIHDSDGRPILRKGEILLSQDDNSRCGILRTRRRTWSSLGGTLIFPNLGVGSLYRTDRRIIYVRTPPISDYAIGEEEWIEDPVDYVQRAKKWLAHGYKESFTILLSEVRKVRRQRKETWLYIEFRGSRYKAVLRTSSHPFI